MLHRIAIAFHSRTIFVANTYVQLSICYFFSLYFFRFSFFNSCELEYVCAFRLELAMMYWIYSDWLSWHESEIYCLCALKSLLSAYWLHDFWSFYLIFIQHKLLLLVLILVVPCHLLIPLRAHKCMFSSWKSYV